ncbi:hypothetical protein U14_02183 [Candidatus Moduliflexus flocculans]|uniref:DUF5615 domain-containing protein n=1 Tax=Candidatus Moduliflexus flocculans TaxID=1499966 RepID=A0A0S6VTS6_9BACT|nr:hypothetical protein U14_02183 [Candidatus Moduliflexus flocculans]
MKFLLNMNVPPQLGRHLMQLGHHCRHVRELGMARAADYEIVAEARRQQETILTHDLDYGHLLAFSGEAWPSVIIFRVRQTNADYLLQRLLRVWAAIEQPLTEGAIVVLEDAALRIRKLPIVAS